MSFDSTLLNPDVEQQQLIDVLKAVHATPEITLCKRVTASTNDDVLELYKQGYRSALVISQQQSHGRGQHQRLWQSTTGNIFLSCLIELERPVDGRFSLECGLNILACPSLMTLNNQLQIKWANDLYSPLGKWGGILIEPINAQQLIVGIGINVLPIQHSTNIEQPFSSLTELGLTHYNRIAFLSEIYLAILQASEWFNYGSRNLAQRFNHIAAFKDRWIHVQRNKHMDISGYFLGIQDDGAILIQQTPDQAPTVCYDGRLIIPE